MIPKTTCLDCRIKKVNMCCSFFTGIFKYSTDFVLGGFLLPKKKYLINKIALV